MGERLKPLELHDRWRSSERMQGLMDEHPAKKERENAGKERGVPGTVGGVEDCNHGGREEKNPSVARAAVEQIGRNLGEGRG